MPFVSPMSLWFNPLVGDRCVWILKWISPVYSVLFALFFRFLCTYKMHFGFEVQNNPSYNPCTLSMTISAVWGLF